MKEDGFEYNVDSTPIKISRQTERIDIEDRIRWSIADAKLRELGIDFGSTLYDSDDPKDLEDDDISIVLDCIANDRKIPKDVEKRLKEKAKNRPKKEEPVEVKLTLKEMVNIIRNGIRKDKNK